MKLYFRYAAMNSGKSTSLLQIANNYEERNVPVVLFTSAIDDRYGVGKITSRLGISREAHLYDGQFSFLAFLEGISPGCVLVDEAQFLTSAQVWQLHEYAHTKNVPVICFGLRTDFKGTLFEGSSTLLGIADDLEELKTICACGKKASFNIRINADNKRIISGNQIAIESGAMRYDSICGDCLYTRAVAD